MGQFLHRRPDNKLVVLKHGPKTSYNNPFTGQLETLDLVQAVEQLDVPPLCAFASIDDTAFESLNLYQKQNLAELIKRELIQFGAKGLGALFANWVFGRIVWVEAQSSAHGGWFCKASGTEGSLLGYQSLSNHQVSHMFVGFSQTLQDFYQEFRHDNLGRRLLARLPDYNLNPKHSEYKDIEPVVYAKSFLRKRLPAQTEVLVSSCLYDTDSCLPRSRIDRSECYKPRVLEPALNIVRSLLKDSSMRESNDTVVRLLLEYVNLKLEQSVDSKTPGFIVNGALLHQDFGEFLGEKIRSGHAAIFDRQCEDTLESLKSIWLKDFRIYMQRCCPGVEWSAKNKRDLGGRNQRGFIGVRWKPGCEPF